MIDLREVQVRMGSRDILTDVTAAIPSGRVVGVVGPNGSGKSTLLRALIRAVPLASGSVHLAGTDLASMRRREIARRVCIVGQAHADGSLTVAEEVALGRLAAKGLGSATSDDHLVADAVGRLGLSELAHARLDSLSGGERQRVAFARALVQHAECALLDEPTNHLDLRYRLELADLIRDIAPTVVVVLHDLEFAARVCDEILLIEAGRVAAAGAPRDVLSPDTIRSVYDVDAEVTPGRTGLKFDFSLPVPSTPASPPRPPSQEHGA
ncbi:ABC transporter ATP-binding protein [Microbacterium sp.]|uniref:ABC transporter ATP-binding protein n=1 Tax=Microbacterium sp. TaxID=51671 RepID=UPI003A859603